MDESLEILVAYYEDEKKHLLQQIEEYAKDWEFEFAQFHTQALYKVNSRLRTLYSLQDRNFPDKDMKKNIILNLENKIQSEGSAPMLEYFTLRLQKEKESLSILEQNIDPVKDLHSNLFNQSLNQLLKREIRQLTLHLNRDDQFIFEFSYRAKVLKVNIPYIKKHLRNNILTEENMIVLGKMGFVYNKNKSSLTLLIHEAREKIASEINWRIAKIVFELLQFSSFEGKTFIEIRDRSR